MPPDSDGLTSAVVAGAGHPVQPAGIATIGLDQLEARTAVAARHPVRQMLAGGRGSEHQEAGYPNHEGTTQHRVQSRRAPVVHRVLLHPVHPIADLGLEFQRIGRIPFDAATTLRLGIRMKLSVEGVERVDDCLLYTSPSPRD